MRRTETMASEIRSSSRVVQRLSVWAGEMMAALHSMIVLVPVTMVTKRLRHQQHMIASVAEYRIQVQCLSTTCCQDHDAMRYRVQQQCSDAAADVVQNVSEGSTRKKTNTPGSNSMHKKLYNQYSHTKIDERSAAVRSNSRSTITGSVTNGCVANMDRTRTKAANGDDGALERYDDDAVKT